MSSTGPRIIYRTPADVRAIPNRQWEEWFQAGVLPFTAFAATRDVQKTLATVVNATKRRLK